MSITREELSFHPAKSVAPLIGGADGKTVVLQCTLESGVTINIAFDADHANQLTQNLATLLSSSLNSQTSIGGAGFVRMTEISQANANATDSPGRVALGLIDTVGLAHYFSFPVETSGALRSALRTAESAARAGVRLPRA